MSWFNLPSRPWEERCDPEMARCFGTIRWRSPLFVGPTRVGTVSKQQLDCRELSRFRRFHQ